MSTEMCKKQRVGRYLRNILYFPVFCFSSYCRICLVEIIEIILLTNRKLNYTDIVRLCASCNLVSSKMLEAKKNNKL